MAAARGVARASRVERCLGCSFVQGQPICRLDCHGVAAAFGPIAAAAAAALRAIAARAVARGVVVPVSRVAAAPAAAPVRLAVTDSGAGSTAAVGAWPGLRRRVRVPAFQANVRISYARLHPSGRHGREASRAGAALKPSRAAPFPSLHGSPAFPPQEFLRDGFSRIPAARFFVPGMPRLKDLLQALSPPSFEPAVHRP